MEVVGGSKIHCIGGREYSCLNLWTSVQTCRLLFSWTRQDGQVYMR